MAVADCYQTLFDALRTRSMSKLAEAAYDIMQMPVVVTDAAFIVRAKYPDQPLGDEQWDANMVNRQIEPRFVKTFTDDDHFARHDQAGRAILTDWGHYEAAPRLTSVMRLDGAIVGYFAALATGVEVQPWHYEVADLIGDAFAMLMDAGTGNRLARAGLTSPALYALLDGPTKSEVNLQLLPAEFFDQNQPPFMLFCARTRNPHNAPLEMYLGNELARYFEHAVQTVYEGRLYILASSVPGDARGSVRGQLLAEELEHQNLVCGVSRPFMKLSEVRIRSWEAESALRVGANLASGGPLLHYEDFVSDIVCELLDDQLPEGSLEAPALKALRAHDEANGTSYLQTLRAYIAAGFDKKRTCEALHIHRNTLQYRLGRMAEMQGLDVNDAFYGLYFMVQDYRERRAEAERAAKSARRSGKGTGA